jgi:hypothetical protein
MVILWAGPVSLKRLEMKYEGGRIEDRAASLPTGFHLLKIDTLPCIFFPPSYFIS